MKRGEKPKCLVPSCDRHAFSRGLCKGHYVYAARLVKRGEYTWDKLEKKGKVLSPSYGRRVNALRVWFESK